MVSFDTERTESREITEGLAVFFSVFSVVLVFSVLLLCMTGLGPRALSV